LENFYKKSPYYYVGMEVIENTFVNKTMNIAELAKTSLVCCCALFGIEIKMRSSLEYPSNGLKKEERIINICQQTGANMYINAIGGMDIYSYKNFKINNIDLKFVHSELCHYSNGKVVHTSLLSILDLIMLCGPEKIRNTFLMDYYIA
jgi:hypothetical protein